jgi:kumamolisin
MPTENYICIPNSEQPPLTGATREGDIGDDEIVEVTLRLPARTPEPSAAETEALSLKPIGQRRYDTREAYAAGHGASEDSLSTVEAFAGAQGLHVVRESIAERSVTLRGSAKAMAKAFRVKFGRYQTANQTYRGYEGPIQIPAEIASTVQSVTGLDDRQFASPHNDSGV